MNYERGDQIASFFLRVGSSGWPLWGLHRWKLGAYAGWEKIKLLSFRVGWSGDW
jgi:hypothetical protein